ncbi:MAG TPA: nuclear transport factor 2 family protein [Rhizomicrobium sp.]|jgi:ketosteroid isomerase-like protein
MQHVIVGGQSCYDGEAKGKQMTPADLMRTVVKGLAANDMRPLMAVVDDNTVWKSAAGVGNPFRFGGEYRTRAGIADVTSNIFAAYTFLRFDAQEIVSEGEVVWGLFDVECVYHTPKDRGGADKPVRYECALRWQVRNGMLVEWQAFFDTLSVLRQQGEF